MPEPRPSVAETRRALVTHIRDRLADELNEVRQKVPSGEWEGVPVVTDVDLIGTLDKVFAEPLPRSSEHHAEVETRGEVIVTAVCPLCFKTGEILLTVDVELHASGTSRSLHLKAASKARAHICGQESLPLADIEDEGGPTSPIADGQVGLDELVGERCPNPGCILPADHEGDHIRSAADQEADPDGPTEAEVEDIEGLPQEPHPEDVGTGDDEPPAKPKRGRREPIVDPSAEGDDDLLPE